MWSVGVDGRWVDLVLGAELTELRTVVDDETVIGAVVHGGTEEHEVLVRQPLQDRVVVGKCRHPIADLGEVVDHEMDVGDRPRASASSRVAAAAPQ